MKEGLKKGEGERKWEEARNEGRRRRKEWE